MEMLETWKIAFSALHLKRISVVHNMIYGYCQLDKSEKLLSHGRGGLRIHVCSWVKVWVSEGEKELMPRNLELEMELHFRHHGYIFMEGRKRVIILWGSKPYLHV